MTAAQEAERTSNMEQYSRRYLAAKSDVPNAGRWAFVLKRMLEYDFSSNEMPSHDTVEGMKQVAFALIESVEGAGKVFESDDGRRHVRSTAD